MTHTVTVRGMKANEDGRGNLAGYVLNCPCGFRFATTMQSEIPFVIAEHVRVMARPSKRNKPTIYEALAIKLGRIPTNAELKADVERIKQEAVIELASAGRLPYQRR